MRRLVPAVAMLGLGSGCDEGEPPLPGDYDGFSCPKQTWIGADADDDTLGFTAEEAVEASQFAGGALTYRDGTRVRIDFAFERRASPVEITDPSWEPQYTTAEQEAFCEEQGYKPSMRVSTDLRMSTDDGFFDEADTFILEVRQDPTGSLVPYAVGLGVDDARTMAGAWPIPETYRDEALYERVSLAFWGIFGEPTLLFWPDKETQVAIGNGTVIGAGVLAPDAPRDEEACPNGRCEFLVGTFELDPPG